MLLTPDTTYLYKVRGVLATNAGPLSTLDLATTTIFADYPLQPNVTPVKKDQMYQARMAVNAVREAALLSDYAFTDLSLDGVGVKSIHITQPRDALNEALTRLGLPPLVPANSAAPGTPIRAQDVGEIWNGTK
jgi:hypothetical protein